MGNTDDQNERGKEMTKNWFNEKLQVNHFFLDHFSDVNLLNTKKVLDFVENYIGNTTENDKGRK